MSASEVEPTTDEKIPSDVEAQLEEQAEDLANKKAKPKPEEVARGQRVVPYSEFERGKGQKKVREGQYEV